MLRKLLILACLLAVHLFSYAQTISPAVSDAVCPGVQRTYTVTDITGDELTIQSSTGLTSLTSGLDGSGNFTFTGIIPDGPATVTLANTSSGNTYPVLTINVSTLKGITPVYLATPANAIPPYADIIDPNLCSTASFTYVGPQAFYKYKGTNSTNPVGLYSWTVPAGWAINGTVPASGHAVTAGSTITVTPNATSAGVMTVAALNDCGASLTQSAKLQILVNRPAVASLTVNGSTTTTITCGNANPVTFNVTGSLGCVTGYKWSMPSGWLDANGNAITTITTTTPSLTLTPQAFTAPSDVTVSLMVNGSAVFLDTYTETVLYNNVPPITAISGKESFCGADPQTYTVTGLTAGASASTFTVNTAQLTGSITTSSSGNTLTITNPGGSASGVIFISASTVTPCGTALTTVPQSQPTGLRVVVGQPAPAIFGFNQGETIASGTGPYNLTMVPPSTAEPIINYSWNITPHTTISGQNTANVTFSINAPPPAGWTTVSMIVQYQTACGWSNFLSTYFLAKPGTTGGGPPPPMPLIRPTASSAQVAIVTTPPEGILPLADGQSKAATAAAPPSTIKAVVVFNTVGQLRKKQQFGGNNTMEYLDIHDLPNGIYFIQITTSNGTTTEKYLVQH